MKRWLRVCLLVLLIAGLVLISRRELGIRQSVRDTEEAARLAGVPMETAAPPSSDAEAEETDDAPDGAPEQVPEAGADPADAEPGPSQAEAAAPPELAGPVDLEALRAVNEDVVGWIMIPGTGLSYPVVQGEDNEYYLDHTWKGNYSASGSIFMECGNDPSLEGFHTILYGHRMRNGSMFGILRHYSSAAYWRQHPSVYLVSGGNVYRYDIFAAQEVGTGEIVYWLDLAGREEDFIRFCQKHSVIDTGIEPEPGDRFLTLSTCTGQGYATRWTVQAVLRECVPAEETP